MIYVSKFRVRKRGRLATLSKPSGKVICSSCAGYALFRHVIIDSQFISNLSGKRGETEVYSHMQVPKWFQASRSFAIGTIQIPVTFTKQAAQRVHHYCQQKGLGQEFFTTLAGILAGVLVSSLLVK